MDLNAWANRARLSANFAWRSTLMFPEVLRQVWQGNAGVLEFVLAAGMGLSRNPGHTDADVQQALTPPAEGVVKLFGWELSYFSGKVRGYLRHKCRLSDGRLHYEEVVACPRICAQVLMSKTGSNTVPQILLHDGRWVHDSSEIIDIVEAMPECRGVPPVLPPPSKPRQRLVCELLELLGDEWLLTPAFHWRWAYSGDGSESQRMPAFMGGAKPLPNHREWNEMQWGAFLKPKASPPEQRSAAQFLFNTFFLSEMGIKGDMVGLGVTEATVAAWEASARNVLSLFNTHLASYDFVLGGRPSTADFGLLGPLYAHLYRDPVPGDMMRREFPRVAAWCERLHDEGGARSAGGGVGPEDWLDDDQVPETVLPLLHVFFNEFWPVLKSSCEVLARYLRPSGTKSVRLPDKSFTAASPDQQGSGPLVHKFSLPFDRQGRPGGISEGRRMVLPYHVWMLQRVEATLSACNRSVVEEFVAAFPNGKDLGRLSDMLAPCRVRKVGGRIFSDPQLPPRSRL